MNGCRGVLLGAIALFLLLPGAAEGAKVRTDSDGVASVVDYQAKTGETDAVTISRAGRQELEFRSAAAPLDAGKGCRSAGGGEVVRCRPKQPGAIHFLPSGHRDFGPVFVSVSLSDADDTMDAGALPRGLTLDGERIELILSASGGDGADRLAGGAGDDMFFEDRGDDAVTGGGGSDTFQSGPRPDGADSFDGGAGRDVVDFSARKKPVTVLPDGLANDGGAGEGDSIASAEFIFGGAGDDLLAGGESRDFIIGAGGDDHLVGNEGGDQLLGDFLTRRGGDDTLVGGAGNDFAFAGQGRDVVLGGAGKDEVEVASNDEGGREPDQRDRVDCGDGQDDARAQRKDRLSACENVRRVG